ncbi:MAG TPA: asparagine synthase (glutamine-hydrolyzing) [Lachnospiraceae bacterium]|nr:asparagine synthase (glutamine-hydrolyzing) [Lachnospiraceae bacterium]
MCGIAGFFNVKENYKAEEAKWLSVLHKMNRSQKHRGPDEDGVFLGTHCGLAHVRLSIIDLLAGQQPMIRQAGENVWAVVYNGEIYNMGKLKKELEEAGEKFLTNSDTEVILAGYMRYGTDFVKRLNGIFAFAVWDGKLERLFLFRDRAGVKPCFYTKSKDTVIFSSEIKGIFRFPGVEPAVDREGLCEVLGLGPAKTYGKGVFQGILEVLPGHFLECGADGCREHCYWKLESRVHEDTWEKTVEKMQYLIEDAVKMQMLSDVPICTFLSGGIDSSLVTAICSRELQKKGKVLDTYSFDFKDNDVNFKANAFQPSQDRPWVDKVKEFAHTRHHYLECRNEELYDYLFEAVRARDLPCMADVESSMLYFCRKVAANHKVTLTGECADEIFGGYPWFHKKECFEADMFPWSMDFKPRTMLLRDEVLEELPIQEYAKEAYHRTVAETPVLEGEGGEEKRRREISYLNLRWFMQTLLDRMDRTSMHVGLEARVPFADHRIIEYAWNVPWDMKYHDGVVKALLRAAGKEHLPQEVLYRRKSPYPKTYDPAYEQLVRGHMLEVLEDARAPLRQLVDREKVKRFMEQPSDYARPFYGQLMAGPQLLAYLLQVNYWLEHYKVRLVS